jgi:hypothetical protein
MASRRALPKLTWWSGKDFVWRQGLWCRGEGAVRIHLQHGLIQLLILTGVFWNHEMAECLSRGHQRGTNNSVIGTRITLYEYRLLTTRCSFRVSRCRVVRVTIQPISFTAYNAYAPVRYHYEWTLYFKYRKQQPQKDPLPEQLLFLPHGSPRLFIITTSTASPPSPPLKRGWARQHSHRSNQTCRKWRRRQLGTRPVFGGGWKGRQHKEAVLTQPLTKGWDTAHSQSTNGQRFPWVLGTLVQSESTPLYAFSFRVQGTCPLPCLDTPLSFQIS